MSGTEVVVMGAKDGAGARGVECVWGTYGSHIHHQLPQRFAASAGEHVPQRVVHRAKRDVDHALFRANPAATLSVYQA